jgi:hypothetical protein
MRGRLGGMTWLDRISFLGLVALYVAVVIASPVIGALLFFFELFQIRERMGWEFSNLGPAGTAPWGIMFDVLVTTPVSSCW